MWNLIAAAVVIFFSFTAKPFSVDPEAKTQNNPESEMKQASIEFNNSELKQPKVESAITKNDEQNEETVVISITPTPTKLVTPTIHIEQPPDGFPSKPVITISPTPTPTIYYDEELPVDPLPTRNPCYCDPRKEMHCLDIVIC